MSITAQQKGLVLTQASKLRIGRPANRKLSQRVTMSINLSETRYSSKATSHQILNTVQLNSDEKQSTDATKIHANDAALRAEPYYDRRTATNVSNDARLSVGIGSAHSAGDTKNLLTRIDVALSTKSHSSDCPHWLLLGCVKVNGPIIFFHLTNDWSSEITLNAIDYEGVCARSDSAEGTRLPSTDSPSPV
ncbi:unnamed protein product [Leuciscus chuanchicus]